MRTIDIGLVFGLALLAVSCQSVSKSSRVLEADANDCDPLIRNIDATTSAVKECRLLLEGPRSVKGTPQEWLVAVGKLSTPEKRGLLYLLSQRPNSFTWQEGIRLVGASIPPADLTGHMAFVLRKENCGFEDVLAAKTFCYQYCTERRLPGLDCATEDLKDHTPIARNYVGDISVRGVKTGWNPAAGGFTSDLDVPVRPYNPETANRDTLSARAQKYLEAIRSSVPK